MRAASASTEEGNAAYQQAYLDYIKLCNEECPVVVMNGYTVFDAYGSRLKGYTANGMWEWSQAIVGCWIEE